MSFVLCIQTHNQYFCVNCRNSVLEPASVDLISLGPDAIDEARLRALEGCHLSSKALQVLFQSMFCNHQTEQTCIRGQTRYILLKRTIVMGRALDSAMSFAMTTKRGRCSKPKIDMKSVKL